MLSACTDALFGTAVFEFEFEFEFEVVSIHRTC
jgi:hypothetical protein